MADKKWDTSKGRRWVVVAFWGVETTVDFYNDEAAANAAYEHSVENGADAFYAETKRMELQGEAEFTASGRLMRSAKPKAKRAREA